MPQSQVKILNLNPDRQYLSGLEIIQEFKPNRVAVDSLSALERVSTLKGFREFIIGLTSFIKQQAPFGPRRPTT